MAKTFHAIPTRSGNAHPVSSVVSTRTTSNDPGLKRRRLCRWRVVSGLGALLLFLLCLWLFWWQAVVPVWTYLGDQWHYGDGRITQLDADVGHNGISHFLAEYYQGRIVVIELSLSHPNVSHTYTIGGLMGADGTPRILLTVEDLNHDGKPDVLIQIAGSAFTVTLSNTGTAFTPQGG